MKLERAIEFQETIKDLSLRLNAAIALAANEGMCVELKLSNHNYASFNKTFPKVSAEVKIAPSLIAPPD